MSFSRLFLQILPFTLIGLLSTGLGVWIWPAPTTPEGILLRGLTLLLSFVGLIALKQTENWNVALLVVFGFLMGSFSDLISRGHTNPSFFFSLVIASLLLFVTYIGSRRSYSGSREVGISLWLLAWIYVLGWVGVLLLEVDPSVQIVWASFGLVLFSGMSFFWFSKVRSSVDRVMGSSVGIDLYLIMVNMILASQFLLLRVLI